MKLFVSTYRFSSKIDDDCGSASKVFTRFVDLSAALLTLLTFSGLWGLMTGWCGKYHCNLNGVSFISFDQLSERTRRLHPCQWFPDSVSLAFGLSAAVVLGTRVANCRVEAVRQLPFALTKEVSLRIFHRWITLFVPTSWFLVFCVWNDRWHRSLTRRTIYSTAYSTGLLIYHLQLKLPLWQKFPLEWLVGDNSLSLMPTVELSLRSSWIRKGDWCRNNLARESLEPCLDFRSNLSVPQMWGNGLSSLAVSQSGQPN